MIKTKLNTSGFTLIEILISLALIGIIAISFLTMFSSGITAIHSMGNRTQAMNYEAQMYMDMLYDGLSIADVTNVATTNGHSVTINSTPNYSGTGLRLIEITVDYRQNKQVILKGLVP